LIYLKTKQIWSRRQSSNNLSSRCRRKLWTQDCWSRQSKVNDASRFRGHWSQSMSDTRCRIWLAVVHTGLFTPRMTAKQSLMLQ
jgi:hypothetical protein